MTPKPPDDRADELPPTEAARARRRDHDAAAAERAGMRTGLAKQFKQVLDAQVKRGRAAGQGDEEPPPAGDALGRKRGKGRHARRRATRGGEREGG
jgi:hypothetical protein